MSREVKRAARAAYRNWCVGALDRAVSLLEPLLSTAVLPPEAVYIVARARSERGDCKAALAALGLATKPTVDPHVVRLFRGLIQYDHDHFAEARTELVALSSRNPIAAAVVELIEFGADGTCKDLKLPRVACWMADVAGRLLAILEERLCGLGKGELMDFHRGLFLPSSSRPRDPIEAAFVDANYLEIERLASAEDVVDAKCVDYRAFALIALGQDEKAHRVLSSALEENPACADLHFLEGLRNTRFGRRREAAGSFTCAARLADIDLRDVIFELSKKLGVTIQLAD